MNMNIFDGLDQDPLAETLSAPIREVQADARRFVENCVKCNGTGNWRPGYPCFKCKGTGRMTFKNSREDRARAAVNAARRSENRAEENVEAFKSAHPDLWTWMNGNSFSFATSLVEAVRKHGQLTENQEAAARRCMDMAAERAIRLEAQQLATRTAEADAPVINVDGIVQALTRARANGRRPKLHIGNMRFQFSSAHSRYYPGAVYVTNRARAFLGRITPEGRFIASPLCTTADVARLQEIAVDPRAAAIAHGFNTGSCACCGRLLTDPESVRRGIGPICASHYSW